MEPWGTPRDVVKVLDEVPLSITVLFSVSQIALE